MQPVINVQNLSLAIKNKQVLNGISFQVYSGECLGVFGSGNAAKNTLLYILAGINKFKSGQVEVLGYDLKKSGAFKKSLGLVTREPSLFQELNVAENLDFMATLKGCGKESISRAVDRLQLHDYLNQPLDRLEAGVYQRLSLACALLNAPEILIAGGLLHDDMDIYSRRVITRKLQDFLAAGGTCVCGINSPVYFKFMDRVAWLEGGQVALYGPGEAQKKWDRQTRAIYSASGEGDA